MQTATIPINNSQLAMSVDKITVTRVIKPVKNRKCLNLYGWFVNKLQLQYDKWSQKSSDETISDTTIYTQSQFSIYYSEPSPEGWVVK